MIREEAISVLEQAELKVGIKWRNGRPEVYISPYLQEAIDFALTKLRPISREQVEKAWRGEWLNFYNDFSAAECSTCGELYEVSPDEEPKKEYFGAFKSFYHFCPNCGKAMTDEAVEMVMERLEKLYDTDN